MEFKDVEEFINNLNEKIEDIKEICFICSNFEDEVRGKKECESALITLKNMLCISIDMFLEGQDARELFKSKEK